MIITIINQHTNNFGDEAAGISLIQTLLKKYDDILINIIYNGNGTIHLENEKVIHRVDYKLKNMGYFNILFKLFFHKFSGNEMMKKYDALMKESDYVIISPCGANIGIYKDWRFLIRVLFAIFNGKKPIFYLNTIGNSGNFIFDTMAKYALKKSIVYVREQASQSYLLKNKISCELGVDTAFLFDDLKTIRIEKNRIAFIVTDVTDHKNFKGKKGIEIIQKTILPHLCDFAKKKNMVIHIIPHLNTIEEQYFIDSVIKLMKEKFMFYDVIKENVETVYDYYENIAKSYFVVGMRYHAVVLGAKSNTPFISFAYENKMVEVSNYTNMKEYCIRLYNDSDIKLFNSTGLKLFEAIDNNNSLIRKNLKQQNQKLMKLAKLPLKEISNVKK